MTDLDATPQERALLKSLIQWCRDAAERSTKSGRPDEAMGLMRAAAKLEEAARHGA